MNKKEAEIFQAANTERTALREQAWTEHQKRLEAEWRRYQADLAHIETVYTLRLGYDPNSDPESPLFIP